MERQRGSKRKRVRKSGNTWVESPSPAALSASSSLSGGQLVGFESNENNYLHALFLPELCL
jgi:hypothetical protein